MCAVKQYSWMIIQWFVMIIVKCDDSTVTSQLTYHTSILDADGLVYGLCNSVLPLNFAHHFIKEILQVYNEMNLLLI